MIISEETVNTTLVERWLEQFDGGYPDSDRIREFFTEDARFVERPNLLNPDGGECGLDDLVTAIEAGRAAIRNSSYEVLGHVALDDMVVTRMVWRGEMAIDVEPLQAGTKLTAWCVAHYRIQGGQITHIEQHDCYEQPNA